MKITATYALPQGQLVLTTEDKTSPLDYTTITHTDARLFEELVGFPARFTMDEAESIFVLEGERIGVVPEIKREGALAPWSTGIPVDVINAAEGEGRPCGDSWIAPGKECRKEGAYFMKLPTNLKGARLVAKAFLGKPITNEADGRVVMVSSNNLKKMTSRSATQKSLNPKLHAFAVANLDHLFAKSFLQESHDDRAQDTNIKKIHRYASTMKIKEEAFRIKITVKEFSTDVEIAKIYTVEVLK